MARKSGLGPRGQNLLSRLQEGNESSSMAQSYLDKVQELGDVIQTQTTENIPDLWPDTSNYGQGPFLSTRVHRHRFVFDDGGPTGTAYVQFKNLRRGKNGEIYEKTGNARTGSGVVYAYYNLTYNEYLSFTSSSSKGGMINQWTRRGSDKYENLGKNDSVFSVVSPARYDVRKERYNPAAPYTSYQPTED